ncbi:MAG TPA: SLC13 family permease [Candidatus Tripitaka californicus]|uniref:SLC13 family permease n=1 Tax=Candidatus Tripitaka californicus TaxID=3367616 RepID=UPI00402525FC
MIKALLIFLITYFIISAQRISWPWLDRPPGALLGAVLMVGLGVMTLEEAYRAIDLNTIVLLLGMMIIVAYLKVANFFEYLAYILLRWSRSATGLLCLVSLSSAVLSALFINDTVCLLFTPLLLSALSKTRLNPVPFLIALATSSNIGSVVTLTGNPQNMIIGVLSGWGYWQYCLYLLPVGCLALILNVAVIYLFFHKDLAKKGLDHLTPSEPSLDGDLMTRLGLILIAVFLGFTFSRNLPLVSIVGGTAALVFSGVRPSSALERVNWPLLLFFGCLFIVVAGVKKVGVVDMLYGQIEPLLGQSLPSQIVGFSLFSVLASNLVSNVPYVILASQWMDRFSEPSVMWLVLAMSSTFAGNLTIVGSVANMIVMELSRETVHIGFFQFLKVGLTVTILSVAVGVAIMVILFR